jgi:hypothetical protein
VGLIVASQVESLRVSLLLNLALHTIHEIKSRFSDEVTYMEQELPTLPEHMREFHPIVMELLFNNDWSEAPRF